MIPMNNAVPAVDFCNAITSGFKNYANYDGRIRRSEFWFFVLFNFIIIFILFFLTFTIYGLYLDVIYAIVMIIPISSSIVRRLHDIGKSGYNIFVLIVPISGFIVLLVHLTTDSEQKDNKYGPCQKYILGSNVLIPNTNNNISNYHIKK